MKENGDKGWMRLFSRCLWVLAVLALGGCIESDKVLFPDTAGESIAGLAGAWRRAGPAATFKDIGIARLPNGQYTLYLDDKTAFQDIALFEIDDMLNLVQMVSTGKDDKPDVQYLIIAKLGPELFEFELRDHALPLAASMDVELVKTGNGLKLGPSITGAQFLRFLVHAADDANKHFRLVKVYQRQGPLVRPEDERLTQITQAKDAQSKGAVEALAARGYPEMLVAKAFLGLEANPTERDFKLAVMGLEDAFEFGNADAGLVLANLYLKGPSAVVKPSEQARYHHKPDPAEAIDWVSNALGHGADLTSVLAVWKDLAEHLCGPFEQPVSVSHANLYNRCLDNELFTYAINLGRITQQQYRNSVELARTYKNELLMDSMPRAVFRPAK